MKIDKLQMSQYKLFFIVIHLLSANCASAFTIATISGIIEDKSIEEIEFCIPIDNSFSHGTTYKITPDSDGRFMVSLNIERGSFALVRYKQALRRIFVMPEDSLCVKLSIRGNKRRVIFSGRGASRNEFIDIFEEKFPPEVISKESDPETFFTSMISSRNEKLDFLKMETPNYQLEDEFVRIFQYDIRYSTLAGLGYFFSRVEKRNEKEWSYFFEEGMHLERVSNDSALASLSYHEYVNVYTTFFRLKYLDEIKISEIESPYTAKALMLNKYFQGEALEISLASNLLTAIQNKTDWKYVDTLYSDFNSKSPSSRYSQLIASFIDQYGQEETKSDKLISTSIRNNLEDVLSKFKGKVVYVDFWATWCGPCLREFEYIEQLRSHFRDKNIVFLYVSVDRIDDRDKWEKYIARFNLDGENVIIPEALTQLKIQGIPRYFIVDKEGRIVNANALRPSQLDKLYQQIEEYL